MENYKRYILKENNQDQEVLDVIIKSLQYQDLDILKKIFNVNIEEIDESTMLIKVDILNEYIDLLEEDDYYNQETSAEKEMREYLDSIDEEF